MFSMAFLDFFAKAGIKRRERKKCDHHCDKDQVIHNNFRRGMRLKWRQDATGPGGGVNQKPAGKR
jgi:hypothetical protein